MTAAVLLFLGFWYFIGFWNTIGLIILSMVAGMVGYILLMIIIVLWYSAKEKARTNERS